MNCCPDRCDIEFEYDWKYTNICMNYLVGNPPYFLNANDKLNLTMKEDAFDHVYLVSEKGKIELTKDSLTWSGIVPSSWTQTGSFQVIVERSGRKTLLYQGMLNNEQLSGNTSASTGSLHQDFELVITPDDIDSETHFANNACMFKVGSDIENSSKDMFAWINENRSKIINVQVYAEYETNAMGNYSNFETYSSVDGGELTKHIFTETDSTVVYDCLGIDCSGILTSSNISDTQAIGTWQIVRVYQKDENIAEDRYGISGLLIGTFLVPRESMSEGKDYKLKLKIRLFYIED